MPTRKPLREEISAGGVVIRPSDAADGWEVLLGEQHDRNTGRVSVRLPKGHLDPGESLEEAAIREVLEETGQHAVLRDGGMLGEISYVFFERSRGEQVSKRVTFFLMDDRGPGGDRDGELAEVFWCSLSDAVGRLTFDAEQDVVRRAAEILGTP